MEREPWSSGYGIQLMFKRLWVQIPEQYTGWIWRFFTLICCNNCIVCLKKTKNKRKRGRGWPIFKRWKGAISGVILGCHSFSLKVMLMSCKLLIDRGLLFNYAQYASRSSEKEKTNQLLELYFLSNHLFKYAPNPASFCLFLSFSQYNDKLVKN